MTKDRSPIVLTGNVFVNEHLAREFPDYKQPGTPVRGDIIIHSHLDERGRRNLELKRATKRPTRKTRYLTLSGYFTALLHDGENWRTFHIDQLVGGDGWYTSQKFKQMKIHGVVFELSRLKDRAATWGENSAYEVVQPEPALVTASGTALPAEALPEPARLSCERSNASQLALF